MKKKFWSALLCSAMVLSTGTFVSCSDDDTDELESRITVLEGAYGDIKAQLATALKTGASIVGASQDDKGVWTLTLSDGSTIVIKGSSDAGGAGGSAVTVTQGEGNFTITVDGTSYTIPTGASVNSLIYVPEYEDGLVLLGNEGADVKLLATPAISADALNNATISVADALEVKSRAGATLFKVIGSSVDGAYVKINLKGIGAEATKSYNVAVKMEIGGTAISSNYFTVKVSDDFNFDAEQLGGVTVKADYSPAELADGFMAMTIDAAKLSDSFNFKDLFDALPENAVFQVAPQGNQPGGKAQEKTDLLSKSLAEDGTWNFSERPGTNFNENAERPGFLVYVLADDVIKGKIYVVINDPIAALDFTGGMTGNFEAEWGGTEKYLEVGKQDIDIQKILSNWETEIPTIHGGKDTWFALWNSYQVKTATDDVVIFNDGGKLKVDEYAQKYMKHSSGLNWFYRGFAIYVPQSLATDGKYIADDGSEHSGGEGYGVDIWMGQYLGDPNHYANVAQWGFTMNPATGVLSVPETYTGYGLRIAIGCRFEYDYGDFGIYGTGADQMGMLFFNRRVAPTNATMPSKK